MSELLFLYLKVATGRTKVFVKNSYFTFQLAKNHPSVCIHKARDTVVSGFCTKLSVMPGSREQVFRSFLKM